jgi:hypothetical protein
MELAKTKEEVKEKRLKAFRLINEILSATKKYFGDDIELLEAEQIEQAGDELLCVKKELLELNRKIKHLTAELGE